MKRWAFKILNHCTLTLLGLSVVLLTVQPAFAEGASHNNWQFSTDLYAWAPSIKGETATGEDLDISFSDIVDNLDFSLMAGLAARKGKLALLVDVIYMDVESDSNTMGPLGQVSLAADLEIQAWVVTPGVSYTVVNSSRLQLDLLAGARYLYMETDLDLEERGALTTRKISLSESNHVWDGIVGAQGNVKLNEQWYLPFHFDVGTGDTDLTWQTFGGVGYKFTRVDLVAGYRHLEWDFDDSDTGGNLFKDLYISGPLVGFRYFF